jgi:hypothetical protein
MFIVNVKASLAIPALKASVTLIAPISKGPEVYRLSRPYLYFSAIFTLAVRRRSLDLGTFEGRFFSSR